MIETMPDDFKKGYRKGYEEGLKEAINEAISLITRGYKPQELRMMLKSKLVTLEENMDSKLGRVEEPEPSREPEPEPEEELKFGHSYIVKESRFEKSVNLFLGLVKRRKGLAITRVNPLSQENLMNKSNVQMYWLTAAERSKKAKYGFISPTDLVGLASTISTFLKNKKNKHSVVLLQGVEYLINQTTFNSVLKMIQRINDYVALTQSTLLLSMNPTGMEKMDYSNLMKEMSREI